MTSRREKEMLLKNEENMRTMLDNQENSFNQLPDMGGSDIPFTPMEPWEQDELSFDDRLCFVEKRLNELEAIILNKKNISPQNVKFPGTHGEIMKSSKDIKFPRKTDSGEYYKKP